MHNMETYSLVWQTETGMNIHVRTSGGGEDIRLPKAFIDYNDDRRYTQGDNVDVEVPDWLAEEVGLA